MQGAFRCILGFLLVIAGIIGVILPIVPGLPLLAPGLVLLAPDIPPIRHLLRWLDGRFPAFKKVHQKSDQWLTRIGLSPEPCFGEHCLSKNHPNKTSATDTQPMASEMQVVRAEAKPRDATLSRWLTTPPPGVATHAPHR